MAGLRAVELLPVGAMAITGTATSPPKPRNSAVDFGMTYPFVGDLFKSRCLLEAENLFLRHQLSPSPAIFCGRQFQGRSSWMPLAGIWQSREHIGEPGLQIIRNGQRPDRRLYDLYNRNWLGYGRDSSPPPLRSARTRAVRSSWRRSASGSIRWSSICSGSSSWYWFTPTITRSPDSTCCE